MKVSELIAELQKCKQDREVVLFVDWDTRLEINSVAREAGDNGEVAIGHDLPAELYGEDYRDERG